MDQPIQPVNRRISTTSAERVRPQGTTEVQASCVCTSMLSVAKTSATALPMTCGHAGACSRISRSPRKSINPASAASQPMMTPTVTSHAEKSAHIMSAVRQ